MPGRDALWERMPGAGQGWGRGGPSEGVYCVGKRLPKGLEIEYDQWGELQEQLKGTWGMASMTLRCRLPSAPGRALETNTETEPE